MHTYHQIYFRDAIFFTFPLRFNYVSGTVPLRFCYVSITFPLRFRYVSVTLSLRFCYVFRYVFHYVSFTFPLRFRYAFVTFPNNYVIILYFPLCFCYISTTKWGSLIFGDPNLKTNSNLEFSKSPDLKGGLHP